MKSTQSVSFSHLDLLRVILLKSFQYLSHFFFDFCKFTIKLLKVQYSFQTFSQFLNKDCYTKAFYRTQLFGNFVAPLRILTLFSIDFLHTPLTIHASFTLSPAISKESVNYKGKQFKNKVSFIS